MNRKGIVARTLSLGLLSSLGMAVCQQEAVAGGIDTILPDSGFYPGFPTSSGNTIQFGRSVATDGATLVIGDPYASELGEDITAEGAVFVYQNVGGVWTHEQTIRFPHPTFQDSTSTTRALFGWSVAVHSGTLVVGAPQYGGDMGGAIFVYDKTTDPNDPTPWNKINQNLDNPLDGFGGHTIDDNFGWSVAMNADYIVVGSPGVNENYNQHTGAQAGAAWIYHEHPTVSWAWELADIVAISTETGMIRGQDTDVFDNFGASVALSGQFVIVGAPDASGGALSGVNLAGSVHTFEFEVIGSNVTLYERDKITDLVGASGDDFGASVAVHNALVLVGAPGHDHSGQTDNGQARAYLYTFNGTNFAWDSEGVIRPSTSRYAPTVPATSANAGFGTSVWLDGETAIIGSPGHSIPSYGDGSAWIFKREFVTEADWLSTHPYVLTAPQSASTVHRFGNAVNMTLGLIAVGQEWDLTNAVKEAFTTDIDRVYCPWDLDCDGDVDGADLGLLNGNWGNPGDSDINLDGTTDGADLGLLLAAWGACP
ncbi:MAG: hypothetical protein ACF8GE_01075 [Phycisphaerales bacterium JB043]